MSILLGSVAVSQPPPMLVNLGFIHYVPIGGLDYRITIVIAFDSTKAPPPPQSVMAVIDDPGPVGPEGFATANLSQILVQDNNIHHAIYHDTITFPYGNAQFYISVKACCRPDSIMNMNASYDNSFAFSSMIDLTKKQKNATAHFDQPPVTFARKDSLFYFNPGYYDRDSARDSLSFSVQAIKDTLGPYGTANSDWNPLPGNFAVDSLTGEMTWNPPTAGDYTFRVVAEEYNSAGDLVGSVDYDFYFYVRDIGTNLLAEFLNTNSYPTVGGEFTFTATTGQALNILVTAQDPGGDPLSLSGGGENLSITSSTASFAPVNLDDSTSQGTYTWTSDTADFRQKPYMVVFRADEETGWQDYTANTDLTVWIHVDTSVAITTGESIDKSDAIKVYPNPAANSFAIEFNSSIPGNIKLGITDLQGKLLRESNYSTPKSGKVIIIDSVSDLQSGAYIVRLDLPDGKILNSRFIKK